MKFTDLPPIEYLNQCLSYDPQNGKLYWKERPLFHFKSEHSWKIWTVRFAGKVAGYAMPDHHVQVRLNVCGKTRLFSAHRLAFALMGISIPHGFEVDHKDCNRANNIWTNLRLATRVQNAANQMVHVNRKHTELPKGVSRKRGRFRAQIGFGGKQICLGTFSTPEAANAAYASRAKELYGDFSRGK